MQTSKKLTRKEKVLQQVSRKAPKPEWQEVYGMKHIHLTETQKEFANKIRANDLTFCVAPAGTGKSLTALFTFVQEYLSDNSKQIIFIRTPVEAGMDKIGALPDSLQAKIEPHFASARKLLENLLTKNKVETDLDHRIHFKIPNFCLGATFDNSLIIIDECFTDDHDLLTSTGWKKVSDITEDDLVLQYEEDGSSTFVKPLRVIHKDYSGNLIQYEKSSVSYSVTENHRMVYENSDKELVIKLAKHSSATNWNFITSSVNDNSEYPISNAEIKMAVAMQADGSYTPRPRKSNWQISISRDRKVQRFNEINKELGSPFSLVNDKSDKERFYSSSFSTELLKDGKNKNFNFEILSKFSLRQKLLFIEELALWDGSKYHGNNFVYCTTNKHNVDVVQAIAAMCGYSTGVGISVDPRKESYKTYYRVTVRKEDRCVTQRHDLTKNTVTFTGKVHCVQVPSGMLLTRRNHKVHVSGNCQQLPPLILKLLLERTGINSKVVVLGDNTQLYTDARNRNALLDAIPRFFDKNKQPKYPNVAYHEFGVDDVMRSDLVKTIITAYKGEV
jgi:phosphate starvation-inducible protein PhoH